MTPPPRRLRVAILDVDIPVPNVLAAYGQYSDIFARLLRDAAALQGGVDLEFEAYASYKGEFPARSEIGGFDGIVIGGSASSAYDSDPWIKQLEEFIRYTYTTHPKTHLFGSCFGHQIICHALLTPSPLPSCVRPDPAGWEVGLHSITLSTAFLARFGPVQTSLSRPHPHRSDQLNLQFIHHDHVSAAAATTSLPPNWIPIGSTEHCALQGVYEPGRVLTYQGHFEFDEFVNVETVRVFGPLAGWATEEVERVVAGCRPGRMGESEVDVDANGDARWAAGCVVRFFGEDVEGGEGGSGAVVSGFCSMEVDGEGEEGWLEGREGKESGNQVVVQEA